MSCKPIAANANRACRSSLSCMHARTYLSAACIALLICLQASEWKAYLVLLPVWQMQCDFV